MKKKIAIFSSIGGVLLIAAIILIIVLCLPKNKGYRSIKVYDVKGTVNVKRDKNTLVASKDMKLKNEDVIEVKESSSTVLKLDNDKYVMVKENSTIRLKATGKTNETKTQILVDDGGVIIEVKEKLKEKESFEIATSHSVMAIRGTWAEVSSSKRGNQIVIQNKVLHGAVEIALRTQEAIKSVVKTELVANQKIEMVVPQGGRLITPDDMINASMKIEVPHVSDQVLVEEHGISKVELTTEDIDGIVNAINDFERKDEEKVNGVIKFTNDVSKLQYGIDPTTVFIPDKEYNGIKYYYSETINGEYTLFDSNTLLNVGTSWYFKAISEDAYRSDPFLVEIEQQQLNLSINLSQNIRVAAVGSADIIVSIEDDEFFNSDVAKELDENMQPVNYIVCKAKHYEDEKYYWGELNYRNKEIVFDRFIFSSGNSNGSEEDVIKPVIEFEYHIGDNYTVTNPELQQYVFIDQIIADNIVVYYDYIDGQFHVQLEKGAFSTMPNLTSYEFEDGLAVYFSTDENDGDRDDLDSNDNVDEFSLEYAESSLVDGVYSFRLQARYAPAGDPAYPILEKEKIYIDTNVFNGKLDDLPTGHSRPFMNIGKHIYTFNSDGTINLYVDLQNGLEMFEDPDGELKLGDYLVRYNTQGGIGPDTYVRGNGRFLILENIPFADYVIKDVFAVSEVKDGITYALAHEENDSFIGVLSSIVTLGDPTQTDDGIGHALSFNSQSIVGESITIISSAGADTHDELIFDTEEFTDNSVIVRTNLLITMYAEEYEGIINDSDYTDEYTIALDETNFDYLKTYMKEHHNIDVKGFAEGEFAFKIYFDVTGETL